MILVVGVDHCRWRVSVHDGTRDCDPGSPSSTRQPSCRQFILTVMFGNNNPYLETDPKIGEGRNSLEKHPTEPSKLQAVRAFCFGYNATDWKSTTTVVTKLQEYPLTNKRRTRMTFREQRGRIRALLSGLPCWLFIGKRDLREHSG